MTLDGTTIAVSKRIGGMSWRIDIMASIGRGGARARSGRCGSDRGARGADKGAEPAGPAALALVSGQRLAVFAEFERDILRDRVKAGIAQARKEGRPHGRPPTVAKLSPEVRTLAKKGISKRAIAKRLKTSRTSVRRFLGEARGS